VVFIIRINKKRINNFNKHTKIITCFQRVFISFWANSFFLSNEGMPGHQKSRRFYEK
jgi:hypothetical protein